MVKAKDLSVTYPDGTRAIESVSFTLRAGENTALLGANGAGKSSLILSLVGILPSEGSVEADGVKLTKKNLAKIREKIGVLTDAALAALNIEHLRGKTALKLSGGEKRLAALATVLSMSPDVMLFDEPTAFLDSRARRVLINVLRGLPQTKLIATHDLAFAAELCERAIVLKEGRIAADGSLREILCNSALLEECGIEPPDTELGGIRK